MGRKSSKLTPPAVVHAENHVPKGPLSDAEFEAGLRAIAAVLDHQSNPSPEVSKVPCPNCLVALANFGTRINNRNA